MTSPLGISHLGVQGRRLPQYHPTPRQASLPGRAGQEDGGGMGRWLLPLGEANREGLGLLPANHTTFLFWLGNSPPPRARGSHARRPLQLPLGAPRGLAQVQACQTRAYFASMFVCPHPQLGPSQRACPSPGSVGTFSWVAASAPGRPTALSQVLMVSFQVQPPLYLWQRQWEGAQ